MINIMEQGKRGKGERRDSGCVDYLKKPKGTREDIYFINSEFHNVKFSLPRIIVVVKGLVVKLIEFIELCND